ncbi:hypothetical protein C900_05480 [Fulvivirga imtechensis AK7]|uniref:Adhesin domain-containing protein n=1 Tax=Fulvivirga imtechensis AK7 TaxID=1237149 RepID=L8JJK6_9BACT|nr:hypothetical protein [Fulvivirga imtechensis]ELR69091.1 hypothetical protein C900_05480 [Fulvivirga imtechensis AK7]
MKTSHLTIFLILIGHLLHAQGQVNEQFDASSIEKITLSFKYPELIKITSWDKNEVFIKGTADINNGENNEAFKLKGAVKNGVLSIYSEIEGHDELPRRITIRKDGTVYTFNTDNWNAPEVRKFMEEHGRQHEYISQGVHKEIKLEVFVPRNKPVEVEAKYGMVEIAGVDAPLKVVTKYGGIDISIPVASKRDLEARTKYGQIYTDLEARFDRTGDAILDYNKWTVITTQLNGGGIKYDLESKYGNVYMRKR